jgi:hypothetical protein
MEIKVKLNAMSSNGIPVLSTQAFKSTPAIAALQNDNSRRVRGETSKPVSSPKPPKNTGKAETLSKKINSEVSPFRNNATIGKAKIPSPPIRGVGTLCDDCFAADVCPFAVRFT